MESETEQMELGELAESGANMGVTVPVTQTLQSRVVAEARPAESVVMRTERVIEERAEEQTTTDMSDLAATMPQLYQEARRMEQQVSRRYLQEVAAHKEALRAIAAGGHHDNAAVMTSTQHASETERHAEHRMMDTSEPTRAVAPQPAVARPTEHDARTNLPRMMNQRDVNDVTMDGRSRTRTDPDQQASDNGQRAANNTSVQPVTRVEDAHVRATSRQEPSGRNMMDRATMNNVMSSNTERNREIPHAALQTLQQLLQQGTDTEATEGMTTDSDDYSTSQEGEDVVNERLKAGGNFQNWPWKKMQRVIHTHEKRRQRAEIQRDMSEQIKQQEEQKQLRKRLQQLEQRMELQQEENDAAKWREELAQKRIMLEKEKNEALAALVAEQGVVKNKDTAQETVEDVDMQESEERHVTNGAQAPGQGKERSKLTVSHRGSGKAVQSINCHAHAGDATNVITTGGIEIMTSDESSDEQNVCVKLPQGVKLKIPDFMGRNWPAYKNQFEAIASSQGWNDVTKAAVLRNHLQGDAANILSDPACLKWSYAKLVEQLEMRHGKTKNPGDIQKELLSMYRKPGQTLTSWYDEVIKVVNTGQLTESEAELQKFLGFTNGLKSYHALYYHVMRNNNDISINSAFDKAHRYELKHGSSYDFGTTANINMVEENERDMTDANVGSQMDALRKLSEKQGTEVEKKLTSVLETQFQQLGNSMGQRFDLVESRLRRLEQPSRGGFNFNNRPNRGYADDRRRMNMQMNGEQQNSFTRGNGYNQRGRGGYARGGSYGGRQYEQRNPQQWMNSGAGDNQTKKSNHDGKPLPQRDMTEQKRPRNQREE